ncbi:hypothetical protein GP486_000073 [Trichoglossum hirsutum]|uniref:Uncharacterized protein n=1 Tax=Trichoglossum hirsutum TaxID=265104 RepID=A0A9P8LJK3_9PEZI|nr:hypothetical protein GP486_000073 [Trichoglossum hirsutum]
MNWTGGRRSRHSHHNVRSVASVQRQHFAKVRNRLHSKGQLSHSVSAAPSGRGKRAIGSDPFTLELSHSLAKTEDDAATCDQGLARTRSDPLPAALSADVDLSPGIANLAGRRHLSVTANPINPLLLANRKRKLLKRDDWVGTTITRPLKIRYPPAVDGQMIGKRRKLAGDSHRHRMLFAAEHAGPSRVGRDRVGRRGRHDWVAGRHGLTVRIGEPLASRQGDGYGDESMQEARFDGPYESTPPGSNRVTTLESLLSSSRTRANPALAAGYYTTGIVAKSPMVGNGSRVAAPKIPRRNTHRTQSSGNETTSVGQPSSPITSKRGSSVGYIDARPNRSDASVSSPPYQSSSTSTIGHNTHPQFLACDGKYVEEKGVSLENIRKQENKVSLSYVRAGSDTTLANRTTVNTPSRAFSSPDNPQAETSGPKTIKTDDGGEPDASAAPDELFWRSWLSTFARDEPDVVGQTRTPRTSSQGSNARKCMGDAQPDLDSTITCNAAWGSSPTKLEHHAMAHTLSIPTEHHSKHPLVMERRHRATLPVKCVPTLNMERTNHDEAYFGDHPWDMEEPLDQFLGLNRHLSENCIQNSIIGQAPSPDFVPEKNAPSN